MTVDELLRQRELSALLDDWQHATDGMNEQEAAAFLAQSLNLAADARRFARQLKRAGDRASFQMRLMQMAGRI